MSNVSSFASKTDSEALYDYDDHHDYDHDEHYDYDDTDDNAGTKCPMFLPLRAKQLARRLT